MSKATFDLTEFFKSNGMEVKSNDISMVKHHYLVGTVHAMGTEVRYVYYVFLKETGALPVQLKKNLVISSQTCGNCLDFLPPYIVMHSENEDGELEISFFDVFSGNRVVHRNVLPSRGSPILHDIQQIALGPNFMALCSSTRLYLYFHCHFTRLSQLSSPSAVLALPFSGSPVISLSLHSPSLTLLAGSPSQAVVFDLVNLRALASLTPPPLHVFSELLVSENSVFALLGGRAALLFARLLAPHEARARSGSVSASPPAAGATAVTTSTSGACASLFYPLPARASAMQAHEDHVSLTFASGLTLLFEPRAAQPLAHAVRAPTQSPPPLFPPSTLFAGAGISAAGDPPGAAELTPGTAAASGSAALAPAGSPSPSPPSPSPPAFSASPPSADGSSAAAGVMGASSAAPLPPGAPGSSFSSFSSSPAASPAAGPAYASPPSAALSALHAREFALDLALFLRFLGAHGALDLATASALDSRTRLSLTGALAPLATPRLFLSGRGRHARALPPPPRAAHVLPLSCALPGARATLTAVAWPDALASPSLSSPLFLGAAASTTTTTTFRKAHDAKGVWKAKAAAHRVACFPLRGGGARVCLLGERGTRSAVFRDPSLAVGEDERGHAGYRAEAPEVWEATAPPPALLYAAQSPMPGHAMFSPARLADGPETAAAGEGGGSPSLSSSASPSSSFFSSSSTATTTTPSSSTTTANHAGADENGMIGAELPTAADPPLWEALLSTPRWGLRVRWALLAVMEVIRVLLSSHKVQTELTGEMAPTLVSFYCSARDALFLWLLAPDTLRVSHPEAVDAVLATLRDLGRRLGASARAGGMKRLLGSVNLKGRIEVLNGRLFAGVRRFREGLELTPLAHELLQLRLEGPKELTKRLKELYVAKKRVSGSRIRGGTPPREAGARKSMTPVESPSSGRTSSTGSPPSAGSSSTAAGQEAQQQPAAAAIGMDLLGLKAWEMWYGATPMTEWDEFIAAMQEELGLQISEEEEEAMSSVLDSSGTRLVTQVKFMEWLKGFGPLREAPRNTLHLLSQAYFKSYLTRTEAQWLLASEAEGTYLVRFSESSPGAFTLAFVYNGSVLQTQIKYNEEMTDPRQRFRVPVQGTFRFFASVDEILRNFSRLLTIPFVSQLLEKPWFLGDVTRIECEEMLAGKPVGTFLVRFSAQTVGGLAISYVGKPNEVAHASMQKTNDGTFVVGGRPPAFRSMEEILKAYEAVLKFPLKDVERAESEEGDYAVF